MTGTPFASFAQNGEDVVLWRALGHISGGCYVDVGANHPTDDSVSRAFYDHGWRGITVEPVPKLAELLRRDRPGDTVVEAVATSRPGDAATLHEVRDTGLSTLDDQIGDSHRDGGYDVRDVQVQARSLDAILDDAGWSGRDIHFLSIDAEGSESEVLESIDLKRWRPWVLVIESVAPNSDRPTHQQWDDLVISAGYRFTLFDGLSRFYVATERDHEIGGALSAPANVRDNFTTMGQRALAGERDDAVAQRAAAVKQSIQWRTVALERWGERMGESSENAARIAEEHRRVLKEYLAIQSTVSWRVTKPLRAIHERFPRRKAGE
jgi:FkbM family methyltransferase